MRLAFLLYKYFPYGGMQRDFLQFVQALQGRGHEARVYCFTWQGEHAPHVDLRLVPQVSGSSRRRGERYLQWVSEDLSADPVDGVIGFNKMPGLDVYFAADPCYLAKAMNDRGRLYRRGGRFRHFAAYERAVFDPASATRILLISATEQRKFERYYHTPADRMYLLPPGVSARSRRPPDAAQRRAAVRGDLHVRSGELVLLFVGSGYITKGLDRAIRSLASVRAAQPQQAVRLLVVGQDKGRRFARLGRKLGVSDCLHFLGGRDDVPDLMLAADLLVHPALTEAAGIVLLEALVAGLPVVVTDVCGYAHHITAAGAGIVLPSPFSQALLDKAVLRNIDGVYRAECRHSALQYAASADLYSMHSAGARVIENIIVGKQGGIGG